MRFLLTGVSATMLAGALAMAAGGRTIGVVLVAAAVCASAITQTQLREFSFSGIGDAIAGRFGTPKAG